MESLPNIVDDKLTFKYNRKTVFYILDKEYEPWFNGKDIANILEYKKVDQAIAKNVDEEDRMKLEKLMSKDRISQTLPPDTDTKMVFINESGLYSFLSSSRKPQANKFRKWVTKEVLPSIHKTGEHKLRKENEQLILEKKQIISKLKDEQSKNKKLKSVIQKVSNIELNDIIYVVTTDEYQKQNFFKVGGTKENLVKQRLAQYNTGKHPDDIYYYVYLKQCIEYTVIEKLFSTAFTCHKPERNKELYNLAFTDIVCWLDRLTDSSKIILQLNKEDTRSQLFENTSKEHQRVPPIKISSDNSDDKVNVNKLKSNKFTEVIKKSYSTFLQKENAPVNLDRRQFEQHLYEEGYVISKGRKKDLWKRVKIALGPKIVYEY